MRPTTFCLLAGVLVGSNLLADQPQVVQLWPGKVPGDVGISGEPREPLQPTGECPDQDVADAMRGQGADDALGIEGSDLRHDAPR